MFADEAAGEAFQFDGGFVVGSAFDLAGGFADGAEAFEGAESLACGAFADAEEGDQVIEGEGGLGDEEEAVDFADGAWHSEDFDAIDEDADHLALEVVQIAIFGGGFLGGCPHGPFCRVWAGLFNFF